MKIFNKSKFIIFLVGLIIGMVLSQCLKFTRNGISLPNWIKTGGFTVFVLICWDIVRIPIQAWYTKRKMQSNFKKIETDLDDLEKDVEDVIDEVESEQEKGEDNGR